MHVYDCISSLFWYRGGIRQANNVTALNYLIASVGSVFCRPAVNCFFLISGYFLTDKQVITVKYLKKRFLSVWVRAFLCSIFVYIFLVVIKVAPFENNVLLNSFFPILGNRYWFITVFLLMTLIRPYLGKMVVKLQRKELWLLMLILLFFDSIQTTIGNNGFAERGYGFLHAVTMLILGYAIAKFDLTRFRHWFYGTLYVTSCVVAGMIAVVEGRIFPNEVESIVLLYNSPVIIIASVGLFCFFLRIRVENKVFGKMAPHVLTIYLIHDHPVMRKYFWYEVLKCNVIAGSKYLIIHYLLTVVGFVIIGISVDIVISNAYTMIRRKVDNIIKKD